MKLQEKTVAAVSNAKQAAELKRTLRHYCKFHLKPSDLIAVPELAAFMEE